MGIEYADFNATGRCYNAMGEPTGKCPTESDWLAIAWGFLTVMGATAIIGSINAYIRRKRHKKRFKELDNVLPIK